MKLRYKISIWVALALAGSLLWGRKRLALAGRNMCREIPHSATPYHHFGNRSVHLGLYTHHRRNTLVTHSLNRQIYEKKKQDNRTAMQILRSGQHLRVYGIGLPQRKHIRLWGTIQGTQSERQKRVYHLSLFRGCSYPYPRNHFSNNLNGSIQILPRPKDYLLGTHKEEKRLLPFREYWADTSTPFPIARLWQ